MNVHISFCNQSTFTKCTTQKVLENLIVLYFDIFSQLAASLENKNVKLTKNKLFQIVKLTKQTTLSFLTYHECFYFFRWTMYYYVIINYFVNYKFSFCFHYAINEHHQERIQNLAHPFKVLPSFLDIRSKPQKRSTRKLTLYFTKLF